MEQAIQTHNAKYDAVQEETAQLRREQAQRESTVASLVAEASAKARASAEARAEMAESNAAKANLVAKEAQEATIKAEANLERERARLVARISAQRGLRTRAKEAESAKIQITATALQKRELALNERETRLRAFLHRRREEECASTAATVHAAQRDSDTVATFERDVAAVAATFDRAASRVDATLPALEAALMATEGVDAVVSRLHMRAKSNDTQISNLKAQRITLERTLQADDNKAREQILAAQQRAMVAEQRADCLPNRNLKKAETLP